MMKHIKKCFIFFPVLFISFYCTGQRCDSIEWSSRHQLKWRYFKGRPDNSIPANALSEPHIYYSVNIAGRLAHFRITCTFSTCHSWVKNSTSQNLLEHEQAHFDMAEYHKRLLVKEMLSQKFTSANIIEKTRSIGDLINRLRREMDELYDLETEHSVNGEKQKEWSKKVRKMIKGLDDYDKQDYIITLN